MSTDSSKLNEILQEKEKSPNNQQLGFYLLVRFD
jgi:hypothetical protein